MIELSATEAKCSFVLNQRDPSLASELFATLITHRISMGDEDLDVRY